jgi:hypothetical protein
MSITIDNATGKIIGLATAVQAYDAANAARTEQGQIIIAGFKGLDFAAFSAQQVNIVAQLVSAKLSDNQESAKRMLQRVIENLGIEKPKAIGASSDKQASREAAKLETAKLVAGCGITEKSTAEEILVKAGKVTGAAQSALVEAAMVKSKADAKAESVAFTALKSDTCKAVKLASADDIAKIRKILKLK